MTLIEYLYLTIFILITLIRKYFMARHKVERQLVKDTSLPDKFLLGLMGIGMLVPFVILFTDWLSFSEYKPYVPMQWIGIFLFAFSGHVLYRSHADLSRNWNTGVAINEEATLVTGGIYRSMRHPMYAAHLYWAMANVLIIPNWIAGPAMMLVAVVFLPFRIKREEKLMKEQFGQAYKEYAQSIKRLIPGII
ncbi:MAG: protein-S-isoprenylcysteine O-methyltransferase [Cyclobacteriaceae bacterium]|nr:protein-S-isoprenylcysteine O-methyltransferase [Cyclobacteriaceae bacterium]